MIFSINKIGDPILEKPCQEIDFSPPIQTSVFLKEFICNMIETARGHRAVGLAANQVGENLRIFVFNIGDDDWKVAINPVLLWSSPAMETQEEGCLSIPKICAKVSRPVRVDMQFYDENGAKTGLMIGGVNAKANRPNANSNLVARTMLHELDHLNGIFMLERAKEIYYRK